MGTGPVHVSYLRTVEEIGAATWDISTGFARSTEDDGTGSSHVPWPREGGLAWCWEDELWPPWVFSIAIA